MSKRIEQDTCIYFDEMCHGRGALTCSRWDGACTCPQDDMSKDSEPPFDPGDMEFNNAEIPIPDAERFTFIGKELINTGGHCMVMEYAMHDPTTSITYWIYVNEETYGICNQQDFQPDYCDIEDHIFMEGYLAHVFEMGDVLRASWVRWILEAYLAYRSAMDM